MKRILSCALFMSFAVSLAVSLPAVAGTKAEAASKEEARRAQGAAKKAGAISETPMDYIMNEEPKEKECGFIAISESLMNYDDAVAFCRKHGGRLPRINNSDSWDGRDPPPARGIPLIDCFGYWGRLWSEVGVGLPHDSYWTGTAITYGQGRSWVVDGYGGVVYAHVYDQRVDARVVCVL